MNWTGGHLHRHSNNSRNANSKNRRRDTQQFRSKITKDSNWSPFSCLPSSTVAREVDEEQAEITCNDDPTQASSARRLHLPSHQYGDPPLESSRQSQPVSRLDRIKHQLLNEKDWAAVAVTKPLEVAFTRAEEIEKFGKRRKLTEADRKRLADSENIVSWTEPPFHKTGGGRDTPSELRTIKNLNITINGRKVPAESLPSESSSLQANKSSQSMLLDHESACAGKPETAYLSSVRNGEGSILGQGSEVLSNPDQSPLCRKAVMDTSSGPQNGIPDVVKKTSADEVSAVEQNSSHSNQNDSSASGFQSLFNRRRFTLDDQVDQMIAENERRLHATNRVNRSANEFNQERQGSSYHDSIFSPKTMKGLNCYLRRTTHHLEENQVPSNAGCNDQALGSFHDIRALHGPTHREENNSPILLKSHGTNITLSSPEELDPPTSPTKIFGQPVVLGDNAMRSSWNTDPNTSVPNSSARKLNAADIGSSQFKSSLMTHIDLSQDSDAQNQIMLQTQRPNYRYGNAFLIQKPRTMLHSPAALLEGFLQYDQNTFGQGDKQAELLVPTVGYRDNQPSIERFYTKRTSSSDTLSLK
ncbi:uncharacterized protein LDX57_002065 [Aspergillus melleus]|uniref:uncharacterized protein n=1 Tax=Aspergillus melleus TaxID=138277 RepID=UPI001E8CB36A|nr:uncharacterized protein LDX57_002065 [Aspergillus melleus]KAH8424314.1 hypothetical protein LDX57_002065 [Aspergillus melleus]